MITILIIVSILLIAIVLLQAGKAEDSNIIVGSNSSLFKNRKDYEVFQECYQIEYLLVSLDCE